ncbi:branched-chain amino acid ABC transporter permease [Reyranella sp.]|uniref:branched-chain amino acid ABC transporter permease n=1 Tax=Reyranella sp. TaxID=1929291 RepID=UPI003D0D6C24
MNRFLIPGALLALALVYPLLVQSLPVYERLGALVLLGAIGASAWNIVGGYAGQVSVGHAVFFGFGAYSAVVVYTHLGWPPIAGAPLGMALSVLLAAVIGVPTLRLSGHYFSMATIAVGELVRVLSSTSEFLGGAQGLGGPAIPRTVFDLSFLSATPFYYIFLTVLLLLLWLTWAIERGRMGFYLRAIKDSERAARSLGVSAGRYKLYAYMLSGAFTSLAGSLYLCMFGFVDPESGFGILISVKMVVMAALGGAGQLFGPLVGALILVPLEELSNSLLGGQGAGLTFVVYGAIIVIIARFLPSGLLSLLARRKVNRAD